MEYFQIKSDKPEAANRDLEAILSILNRLYAESLCKSNLLLIDLVRACFVCLKLICSDA